MKYQNEKEKDYEVLGEALMPYPLDYPFADFLYITVVVPENEYIQCTGNNNAMLAFTDAEKGKEKQVKNVIDKNILDKDDEKKECESPAKYADILIIKDCLKCYTFRKN